MTAFSLLLSRIHALSEFEGYTVCTATLHDGSDIIWGSDTRDVILGSIEHDTMIGFDGDDILLDAANRMSDILMGGCGNDFLITRKGQDVLLGEDGNDSFLLHTRSDVTVYGGDGFDIAVLSDHRRAYDRFSTVVDSEKRITLIHETTGQEIQLSGIEHIKYGGEDHAWPMF